MLAPLPELGLEQELVPVLEPVLVLAVLVLLPVRLRLLAVLVMLLLLRPMRLRLLAPGLEWARAGEWQWKLAPAPGTESPLQV